ncbi:MAG: NOB1 family endonuclease [Promethearchaeota archaeon]
MVLDAGPLISGIDLSYLGSSAYCYSSSAIIDEVRNRTARQKVDIFILDGSLKVVDAPPQYSVNIKRKARMSGDLKSLSIADIEILALCLFLSESFKFRFNTTSPKLELITDDYSIENVAALLGIKFYSYKQQGIKSYKKWEIYCPGCHKIYNPDYLGTECPVCGEIMKRRVKKKEKPD